MSEPPPMPQGEAPARLAHVAIAVPTDTFSHIARAWQQARLLRAKGFKVTLVLPGTRGGDADSSAGGICVERFGGTASPPSAASALSGIVCASNVLAVSLRLALAQEPVEVFQFVAAPQTFLPLAALLRALGKTVVLDYRASASDIGASPGPVAKAASGILDRLSLALAQVVMVQSGLLQQRLATQFPRVRRKLAVLPDSAKESLKPLAAPDISIRKGRPHAVAYFGDLSPQSRVDLFVRAARRIVFGLQRTDIQFLVIGAGVQRDSLKLLASAEGLTDYVTFIDAHDEAATANALSVADIAVDPADRTPHTDYFIDPALLSLLNFSLPLVAFERRAIRETFQAAAIQPAAVQIPALVDSILDLIDFPDEVAQARARTAQLGEREYRWALNGEIYAKLIESVLPVRRVKSGVPALAAGESQGQH